MRFSLKRLPQALALGAILIFGSPACAVPATEAAAPVASAPAPTAPTTEAAYRLGSGDKIKLTVFGEPELTGEFEVSGSGVLSLPLIGEIQAIGLSTTQLQNSVAAVLRQGYLNDPRVSVEVLNYRPYYILGEVTRAGEYPYSSGLTVMNAVAKANGFTYRADTRSVYIKRAGENVERKVSLTAATAVQPGDTVRIGERLF